MSRTISSQVDTWQTALESLACDSSQPATAMPPEFYSSAELLQKETEAIFLKSWICVGRADEIPESGDYYTLEIIGEPLLVVRSQDGSCKVLSNVCRHRGSVLMQGTGNSKKFSCPYHQWTYALDGK